MNSRSLIRTILYIFVLFFIVAGFKFASVYQRAFKPNIHTPGGNVFHLYIYTGSSYSQVLDTIYKHRLVKNKKSFEWIAKKKKYNSRIRPGTLQGNEQYVEQCFYQYAAIGDAGTGKPGDQCCPYRR